MRQTAAERFTLDGLAWIEGGLERGSRRTRKNARGNLPPRAIREKEGSGRDRRAPRRHPLVYGYNRDQIFFHSKDGRILRDRGTNAPSSDMPRTAARLLFLFGSKTMHPSDHGAHPSPASSRSRTLTPSCTALAAPPRRRSKLEKCRCKTEGTRGLVTTYGRTAAAASAPEYHARKRDRRGKRDKSG